MFFPHSLLLCNCMRRQTELRCPVWLSVRGLGKRKTSLPSSSYLNWLESGREGILQGAARKSPHFLSEHRTRGHEDVPAKRCISRVHKFCVLKVEWNTGLSHSCSARLPVSSLLPSTPLWSCTVKILISKPFSFRHINGFPSQTAPHLTVGLYVGLCALHLFSHPGPVCNHSSTNPNHIK